MKRFVKRVIPPRILRWLKMTREFWAERNRYARFSGPDDGERFGAMKPIHREMQITKDYHRLEKALTLPEPRAPYGADARSRIDALLPQAAAEAADAPFLGYARSAVAAQDLWNQRHELDDEIAQPRVSSDRGIRDPRAFFESRRSVRNFSDRPVDRALAFEAIELAINTPSVCNRQAWRVRLFDDPTHVAAALKHQNGNRGFASTVPLLALITVDIGLFAGPSERNQVYIDGGLFSMSLGWAFHAVGLDSCMLNMSQSNSRLNAARRALGIPGNEAIIMFMAIGYPREGHRVARSPRRALSEVIR